jgi:hypothetical protein
MTMDRPSRPYASAAGDTAQVRAAVATSGVGSNRPPESALSATRYRLSYA